MEQIFLWGVVIGAIIGTIAGIEFALRRWKP